MKIIKYLLLVITLIIVLALGWLGYMAYTTDIKVVGIMDVPPIKFVGIKKESVAMKDYPKVMSEAFDELGKVTKGADVDFGKTFSFYEKSDKKNYDLTMGIEIPSYVSVETTPDEAIFEGITPEIEQAYVVELKGPYNQLSYAWMYAIYKASTLPEYNINENLPSIELYKKTYDDTDNDKEFETLIIIPITKK